jgi:hypothetical protein
MKKSLEHIKIVFILARARSGTTMLQNNLDAHPNIIAPLESKFMLHLKTRYGKVTDWNSKVIDRLCKDIYSNRKFRLFWEVDRKDLRTLFDAYEVNSFGDACKVVYLSFPSLNKKEDIQLIVDKNPAYARFIPALTEVFPDAQFIHLAREPRASVYSQIVAFKKRSVFNLAVLWSFFNKIILEAKIKKHLLHYEKLVSNPEHELKSLMNHLGLPFSEAMLEGHTTLNKKKDKNPFYSLDHHQNVSNPINTKSIDKWKKNLNERQQRIIHRVCHKYATELSYDLPTAKLSVFQKFLFAFARFRVAFNHKVLQTLFKLPFVLRKAIYDFISLFFDRKYKK